MSYHTEDRDDENIICPDCGGTGFHRYLNTTCRTCRGKGMLLDGYEYDEDYDDADDVDFLEED